MITDCTKIFAILVLLSGLTTYAEAGGGVLFRPHAGYGYSDSSDSEYDGAVFHAGGRLLLDVTGNRRYGLEATWFNLKDGDDFTSLGIILEQRLWTWFNMSIGTVGYFGYGENSDNPVGLTTNLGWEPDYDSFKPFITYRNDIIFYDSTVTVHSLSIGFSW